MSEPIALTDAQYQRFRSEFRERLTNLQREHCRLHRVNRELQSLMSEMNVIESSR